MLVGSLGLCHCYLNTIVGSHKSFPFSMTSWVEVARPIKRSHESLYLCCSFKLQLCRLSSLLLGPFSLRVSRLLKRAG